MPKLAIVFCAVLFASAANGAYGPEVEIARAQAEQDLADALFMADRDNFLRNMHDEINTKGQMFASVLWTDVADFLKNNKIDQDTKNKLNPILDEVDRHNQIKLYRLEDSIKLCPEKETEEFIINCYKSISLEAISTPMESVSYLINKVHELSNYNQCKKE